MSRRSTGAISGHGRRLMVVVVVVIGVGSVPFGGLLLIVLRLERTDGRVCNAGRRPFTGGRSPTNGGLTVVYRFGQFVADGFPQGTGLAQTTEPGLSFVDRSRVSLVLWVGTV